MIYDEIEPFVAALPPNGPLIGLDLGTKTIGLALSDSSRMIASPDVTLKKAKLAVDLQNLKSAVLDHKVCGIVLGLPRNMDGSEGPRAQATRAFARNIDSPLGLPILLWDERLSTAAVTRTLLDADASRKRRAEVVDKMAAAYILQGALDRMRHLKGTRP
ncbi:MAG: Holliday junction resolvase RuvX [Alphaproteobacteria bacterium]|nr:MAG: Holliday junction resolvase RuvX [Alphaproteobacteria bacterium]